MNYQIIKYAGGCKNCSTAHMFSTTFMSEDDDNEPFSRLELMEEIDQRKIVCPNCSQKGYIVILFFKIDNIIYDMEYPPKSGFITLEAEKRNDEIISGKLVPSANGFGSYDCLNSLNIIQERLAFFHNNWLSIENRNPNNFHSLPNGAFSFPVKLMDEPPYITSKGYSSRGFSFEEMNTLIAKLRREITDDLTENNMLY